MTTTNIIPEAQIFGYTTVSGAMLDRTNAPRGEVVFNVNNGIVQEALPGEQQLLVVTMNLPSNFAYVLVDLFLQIQATDAEDWESEALCVLNANDDQAIKFNLPSTGFSTFLASGLQSRTYEVVNLPKVLVRPPAVGNTFTINVQQTMNQAPQANTTVYARFLQYDIAQHHDVAVNLPILTR